MYTVPVGEVLVLTAWILVHPYNPVVSFWLLRDSHLDLDSGVPFAAGEQLMFDGPPSADVQHLFYGYERDA